MSEWRRLTVRLTPEQKRWLDAEAERRDRSRGWVLRALIDAARDDAESRYDDGVGDDDLALVRDELRDLRRSVEALDRPVTGGDDCAVTTDAGPVTDGDDSGDPGDVAAVTSGDDPVTGGDDSGPDLPGRPAVVRVVENVADGWDDAPDRLQTRMAAAAYVLEHAVESGEAIGKSSDVVEEAWDLYPVASQERDTWWRKNVRPVLKAVGEYDRGAHGYRVRDLDG